MEQGFDLIDGETRQAWPAGGASVADEIVASVVADEGERSGTTMGATFAAARDMSGLRSRRADGGGKAGGIAARIDAGAQAGRRADTGEDIEARIGGIGNEIERS